MSDDALPLDLQKVDDTAELLMRCVNIAKPENVGQSVVLGVFYGEIQKFRKRLRDSMFPEHSWEPVDTKTTVLYHRCRNCAITRITDELDPKRPMYVIPGRPTGFHLVHIKEPKCQGAPHG